MLKIKDNVDLKELEKFGFKKEEGEYKRTMPHDEDVEMIIFDDREITNWVWGVDRESCDNEYRELLFDLITAGLVEKVKEE